MWEIELKLRVADPLALEKKLDALGQRGESYDKRDTYYKLGVDPLGVTLFRVRREGALSWVTHKVKTVSGGIELSRETEFGVNDPLAFHGFALALGYVIAIEKRKVGRWWRIQNVKAELSEVPPLGHWLELEVLLGEDADDQTLHAAKHSLATTLAELGRSPEEAEERPYIQLLREELRRNS